MALKTIAFVLFLAPHFAFAGTNGGGGGNLGTSTRPQIENAAKQAKQFFIKNRVFEHLYKNFKWNKNDLIEVSIREVIIKKIAFYDDLTPGDFGTTEEIISRTEIFVQNGPCYDKNHVIHDASVTQNKIGGKICLSMNLSRFHPANLKDNLIVILAHEYAHIFGFDEYEAELLENFFDSNRASILVNDRSHERSRIFEQSHSIAADVANFAKLLSDIEKFNNKTRKATRNDVAVQAERISTRIGDFQLSYPDSDPELNLDEKQYTEATGAARRLRKTIDSLYDFAVRHTALEPDLKRIAKRLLEESDRFVISTRTYLNVDAIRMAPYVSEEDIHRGYYLKPKSSKK